MRHRRKSLAGNLLRNKYCTKKGLTLVEVIISIAILGIMSIAFLSMFSSGLIGIFKAGHKSTSHYTAQNEMESNISDSTNTTGNVKSINTTIDLVFPGNNFTISGRKVDVNYNYGNQTKTLTSFTTN
jgi:type IV pilus assembly protein PilA